MNRKVLVAAVAAAFVAPAAFAQSSVTIGGTVNILYDTAKAGGATNNGGAANNDLKSADRVRDGAGSNIRFSVIEDLGGGTSAFVQVETAVIQNSDQRNNALGAGASTAAVWGTRNSGIGIRSKTAGRFLIGVWDVHYHESYAYDPGWIPGNSAQSTLGLTNTFGGTAGVVAIGGRASNVIRWDSPVWSGFSINAAYARPTDAAPANVPNSLVTGKKNRAWNFAPQWEGGGFIVNYSYLQDKDIAGAATTMWSGVTPALGGVAISTGSSLWKVTGNRLGARYKFANGLGIAGLWDQSKQSAEAETAAFVRTSGSSVKRTVWAAMGTFDTGNHHFQLTYARADDWSGNLAGTDVGSINLTAPNNGSVNTVGSSTGAKMWSAGYQYNLSQRTNVSISYAQIRNDTLARYDFFANSSGLGAGGYGADPKTLAVGLRHTW